MRNAGFTIWFTGLSGAGKSTLAWSIERHLKACGRNVEVLDGDIVRTHLSKGPGFSREDRNTNIQRIAFVCNLLTRNGVVSIAAAISPYREAREWARKILDKKPSMPGYLRRRERPWFRKAYALLARVRA